MRFSYLWTRRIAEALQVLRRQSFLSQPDTHASQAQAPCWDRGGQRSSDWDARLPSNFFMRLPHVCWIAVQTS